MKPRTVFLHAAFLCLVALPAPAADWPQWRGPHRDGVSAETGLLSQWPKGGPKLLWKATGLGGGYSTPSVAAGRIYLLGSRGKEEYVFALQEKDGKQLWSRRIGRVGVNKGQQWPGPRSTPTVDGNRLYALGSDGDLACLETDGGQVVWQKNLRDDLGGVQGKWAYAESPLVDGDKVVCTPGGAKQSLVALAKADGKVVWKAAVPGGGPAAYSSIIVGEVGGVRMYVQYLGNVLVGVEAKSGRFLWGYKKTSNRTANIPTAIFHDGYVFSATGYSAGGGLIKLQAQSSEITAEEVWFSGKFKSQIGGFVLVGDHLYGLGGPTLYCVEFLTGKVKWQSPSGKAELCCADGRLYVRSERGPVALVEATPAGYKETGHFEQPDRSDGKAWPYPIVANGCLYLRDEGVLLCYDVRAKASGQ